MKTKSKRVAVAMSGGVDSSVAAFLLLKEGYEVVGVCAQMTEDDSPLVNSKKVCETLGIEFYSVDLREIFNTCVIDYFVESYKGAKTPNPCVVCNKYIKWGALLDYALKDLGADYFASGHYAYLKDGVIRPCKDTFKDQQYFFCMLKKEQMAKVIFPLANLIKDEVKKIAIENNLPSKSAKESQDACFIEKPKSVKEFLIEKIGVHPGEIRHIETNKVLGVHQGFYLFTPGQRKGIGIGYSEPLYVIKTDSKTNIVYVGEEKFLSVREIEIEDLNLFEEMSDEFLVKIRYNMDFIKAKKEGNKIIFNEQIKGVAKGQVCAFYNLEDKRLIGGAWIK